MTISVATKLTAFYLIGVSLCSINAMAGGDPKPNTYKGEFILSRNKYEDPICEAFTRNLNQFRHLDFNECNPRLSKRFPEFSRPQWEEFPFSLEIAERAVKGKHAVRFKLTEQQAADMEKRAEKHWHAWLEQSQQLRQSGKARMWRTRIDFDGDGKVETITRMVPDVGINPVVIATRPPWSCDYNIGDLHMTDNVNAEAEVAFNKSYRGPDIIYFAGDRRYYDVKWVSVKLPYTSDGIDAITSVELFQLNWNKDHVSAGSICLIDWVPAGESKP